MKNNENINKCEHKNKIMWVLALAALAALAIFWFGKDSDDKTNITGGAKEEIVKTKNDVAEKMEKKEEGTMTDDEEEMTHEKDMTMQHIVISDNEVKDGEIEVAGVNMFENGWVVIHNVVDGKAGLVVGHAAVKKGGDTHIKIKIDTEKATEDLIAMAHVDKGVVGKYEFPGVDAPLKVGDKIVLEKFSTKKK